MEYALAKNATHQSPRHVLYPIVAAALATAFAMASLRTSMFLYIPFSVFLMDFQLTSAEMSCVAEGDHSRDFTQDAVEFVEGGDVEA